MLTRRKFIAHSALLAVPCFYGFTKSGTKARDKIMTVNGWLDAGKIGFTLSHEHVLVDFIGAAQVDPARYERDNVFKMALPVLLSAKKGGARP